ncbi:MAG: S41 family peptidase [Cyclobacteriaceae bacterium]
MRLLYVLSFLTILLNCEQNNYAGEKYFDNLQNFAKLYGYVKYFHPSDEAQEIDWDAFAIYGSEKVLGCNSEKELLDTLHQLFKPIAPSMRIFLNENENNLSFSMPEDTVGLKLAYWQHEGLNLGMNISDGTYRSVRVNRDNCKNNSDRSGNLFLRIPIDNNKPTSFRFKSWVNFKQIYFSTAAISVNSINKQGEVIQRKSNDFGYESTGKWIKKTIQSDIKVETEELLINIAVYGRGKLLVDDLKLEFLVNEEWKTVTIENHDFEDVFELQNTSTSRGYYGMNNGYELKVNTKESYSGDNSFEIKFVGSCEKHAGTPIFSQNKNFPEIVSQELVAGISCAMPTSLYILDGHTFPVAKKNDFERLRSELEKIEFNIESNSSRIGNVIVLFNVLKHFYPYDNVIDINWGSLFTSAVEKSLKDQTIDQHIETLTHLLADVKDGHGAVYGGHYIKYSPPIVFEYVDDKVIVTKVIADSITNIKVGDHITHINNIPSKEFFYSRLDQVAQTTDSYVNEVLKYLNSTGSKNSTLTLRIDTQEIQIKRNLSTNEVISESQINDKPFRFFEDSLINYIDLTTLSMSEISSKLETLVNSEALIFDLRGYPVGNHLIISHLLQSSDSVINWLKIPQYSYPDQKRIIGYKEQGWKLQAKDPYLGNKPIFFLINGMTFSYGESIIGFVEGYKLGTLVGEKTAGTNGTVNPFDLLGGLHVRWTGMRVDKLDGSQLQAKGFHPDVYVERTQKGIAEGRDEVLEKAIELAKAELEKSDTK